MDIDLFYHEGWWHSSQTDVPLTDEKMTKSLGRRDFRAKALQVWDQFCFQWFPTVECCSFLQIIITYNLVLENSALFILQVLQIVSCGPWLKYRSHLRKTEDKIKHIRKGKAVTITVKICYQVMHLWKPLISSFPLQLILSLCGPSNILSCFVPEVTPVNGYVPCKTEYIYHI